MPDAQNPNLHTGPGSRPIPDPTLLTTQQLQLAVAALKELITTRLDAMDKAMEVFTTNLHRVPTDVDRQVGALRELVEAKFGGRFDAISEQFRERDVRVEQTQRDSKAAIDAALQAAKDAVAAQNNSSSLAIAKSETATAKAIDSIQILLQTAISTLDGKINDLKDRLTVIEGKTQGQTTAQASAQTSYANVVVIVGLIITTLVGVGGLGLALATRESEPATPQVVERVIIEPEAGGGNAGSTLR